MENRNSEYLLSEFEYYYNRSKYILDSFGGPSIYFHQEAIKAQKSGFLEARHIEMIYATLASWGMHRMGNDEDTKAKLVEYDKFVKTILENKNALYELRENKFNLVCIEEYLDILERMKELFLRMKISISKTFLIANSKTLAHLLPDLIPPIDRQYTIRFFSQDASEFFDKKGKFRMVNVSNDVDKQYRLFVDLCRRIKELFEKSDKSKYLIDGKGFNTSYPKIMDNLIITFVKNVEKPSHSKSLLI